MAQLIGPGQGAFNVGNSEQRDTTQKEPLGAVAYDGLGNKYRYIKAGAAIAQYAAVRFTGSALGWDNVIETSAANQPIVGAAQTAFANADYGWLLVKGLGSIKTSGALAANISLVSAAAGATGAYAATETSLPGAVVMTNTASPQLALIMGVG